MDIFNTKKTRQLTEQIGTLTNRIAVLAKRSARPLTFRTPGANDANKLSPLFAKEYRGYKAAEIDRLVADLSSVSGSANSDILKAHTRLVAISRSLAVNSSYGSQFFSILDRNIVGDQGIRLQSNVKNKNNKKTLDTKANDLLEASFAEWSKKGNCTVCGRYSFREVQRLVVKSQARDGEIIIRKIFGFKNKWGFALQVLEADHLDIGFGNGRTAVGAAGDNVITMSVETDHWGRAVAYHLLTAHPGDNVFFSRDGRKRLRVPSSDILHIFKIDRAGQLRGVPHLTSAMLQINHLSSYEETELIAARAGASKMGFYLKDADSGGQVDEEKEDGTLLQNAEPGSFEQLPDGVTFKEYDPQHPNSAYPEFISRALKSIASALDVPYPALANDLSGINFSSIRAGIIEARTTWRIGQHDLNDNLNTPVYADFLKMTLMTDLKGKLRFTDYDRYLAGARWQARGFAYVNPVQDIKADLLMLQHGLTSFTKIAAEKGNDYAENLVQLSKDLKAAEDAGIKFPIVSGKGEKLDDEVNTGANKSKAGNKGKGEKLDDEVNKNDK